MYILNMGLTENSQRQAVVYFLADRFDYRLIGILIDTGPPPNQSRTKFQVHLDTTTEQLRINFYIKHINQNANQTSNPNLRIFLSDAGSNAY